MNAPELNVPKMGSGSPEALGVPLDQIPQWVAALPLANTLEAATRLHTLLAKMNRHPVAAKNRQETLLRIEPVANPVLEALRKMQLRSTMPLTERSRQAARLIYSLLAELAVGHKLVVRELAEGRFVSGRKARAADSAAKASRFLALLVVNCYLQYAPEPPSVWSDLHRLYTFAQQEGFADRMGRSGDDNAPVGSVEHIYKNVCLLALSNPYQLMLGEAQRVFALLDGWADTATVTPLADQRVPEGVYYADLGSDAAPCYALRGNPAETLRPIAFGVEDLLRNISQRIRQMMASPQLATSLSARQERDLLLRLERAWGVRRRRRFPRTQHVSQLRLAATLSACHHYVSGAARFTPEEHEYHMRQEQLPFQGDLQLVPENQEPWKTGDYIRLATTLAARYGEASFRGRDLSSDVWQKIYVTKPRQADERPLEPIFPAAPLFQRDESVGGLSLLCSQASPVRLQVGELVVYETSTEYESGDWRVGAVRWMLQRPDGDLEVGIKRLARDALAVAVRGLRGVGRDGGYFRALLIPHAHPREKPTALIVPAGVFDVGSVLVMKVDDELLQVTLTKRLETTGCYAVFGFRLTESTVQQWARNGLGDPPDRAQ